VTYPETIENREVFQVKKYKRIPSYRRYWNQPSLICMDKRLSNEQRKRVIEKFLKLTASPGKSG
jgi:hypothetical protein